MQLADIIAEVNARYKNEPFHESTHTPVRATQIKLAIRLAEAKAACEDVGTSFKVWVEKNLKFSYQRARELALAGVTGDPKITAQCLERLREQARLRVRASREKKKREANLTKVFRKVGEKSF